MELIHTAFQIIKEEFFYEFDLDDFYVDPKRAARFDLQYWAGFTKQLWIVPLVALCIYVPFVLLLPTIMKYWSGWRPKKIIAGWNLVLALFSTIGAFVTVRGLLIGPTGILKHGWFHSVCDHAHYGYGYTGFFVFLFIYSKLVELFDTYWLVVGNRQVICLHWYHHTTVLLYCWHAYSVKTSIGLWFVAMNYCVHSVMYLYYFFTQLDGPIRKYVSKYRHLITILQISQMIIGFTVCMYALIHQKDCKANRFNAIIGCIMYASYFYLFLQLFLSMMCKSYPNLQLKSKFTSLSRQLAETMKNEY